MVPCLRRSDREGNLPVVLTKLHPATRTRSRAARSDPFISRWYGESPISVPFFERVGFRFLFGLDGLRRGFAS